MTNAPDAETSPAPLPGDRAGDRHRLPARIVTYWRIKAVATWLPVLAAASFGAWQLDWFTPAIRWAVVGLVGLRLLVELLVAPPIRYRVFWYAISPDEIDLEHGVLVRTRTVVPMNRVQYLKTEHGPIADRFRVATLHVHTAGGAVRMAGLDRGEAEQLRARIAALAHLADDV